MARSHSGWFIGAGALLALAAAALGQDVRYEKYKLDNGLTVVLHEDHSVPVVAVNTWFHVGSREDPPRRNDFAHLFEHLMFMGTARVPNGQFDGIMEAGGGSNNASTGSDITNYFSSGPAALLPTLLWLDADRFEDLGRMMDQDKLDRQREIVRNEYRQSSENQPYGRADLLVQEMMYPPGHPYHVPLLRSDELLTATTVADVKDFFASFYVPNNGSLVVAGDFDPAEVKALIAGLFGTLRRGGEPLRRTAEPVQLDAVKRATVLDKVELPMIALAYHSPARFAGGDAEMALVAALLTDGKTSRLYKRLVYEDKLAVEVSASQDAMQLGSLFHISVLTKPDADLDRVQATIDEELDKFCTAGPAPEELERHKATFELNMLSRLESLETKADLLNQYEYYWGEPNSFQRDLNRYRQATADNVRQWAKTVLTPGARLIVRVLPEEPDRKESPRDQRPADFPQPAFSPPLPERFQLASGIPVLLWQKKELPLVAVKLVFHPGGPLDERPQAGLASVMAAMLDEGAGDLNALQFGDALQSLGATFRTNTDHEAIDASLTVLKRNFAPAVRLLAEAVRRPRFDEPEWERVRRLHVDELKQDEEEPTTVARRVAARLLFGDEHPYGRPVEGTVETVEQLTVADLRRAHDRFVRPDDATLLVAGDISVAEAKELLEQAFGDWKPTGEGLRQTAEYPRPTHERLSIVVVDRPEAVQTVVCCVMPGATYADPARVQYRALNTLLGGSFTSRLVQNLREAHGYTYGVHSSFDLGPSAGYFRALSSVQTDVTGAALRELLGELKRIRTGDISAAETEKARATLRTDTIHALAGSSSLLDTAAEPLAAGLAFETVVQDFQAAADLTADELNRLAGQAIALDRTVLVLVGDKDRIEEQLKGLDLPPVIEVTPRGEPAGQTTQPSAVAAPR